MTKGGKLTKQTGMSDTVVDKAAVESVQLATVNHHVYIAERISELVIRTSEDYEEASGLLTYIRAARKHAEEVFAEKIRNPIIVPARKTLDGLYALERELTKKPWDNAETFVKAKMAAFNQKRLDAGQEIAKAEGSKSGIKRTPIVTDWTKFLTAILAGEVPEGVVQVNEEVMEAYWKVDAGLVSAWPGVSIQEVAKVGGR